MKKLGTLIFLIFLAHIALAQYTLSGSAYMQHFDSLATGLPVGWQLDTNARSTYKGGSALGSFVATPGTTTRWNNTSGGFKNVASADGFSSFAAATAALQLVATDRALGVRQTGSFGDPGAAFTFCIDHTFRLSDLEMDFKIQSLDSVNGSKLSIWVVQYGVGDAPTSFTTVSTGSYSTGGNKFSNHSYTVYFGSALDDIREHVWIRIVSLVPSTGPGSRTTTAIDDVALRWKGIAVTDYRPFVQKLFPRKGATDVPLGSVLTIDFSRNINKGTSGNLYITNETDRTMQTIAAGSSSVSVTGKQLQIAGVVLALANTYHVTFDSTIVDTASATTYAIEDTTEWRFTTMAETSIPNDAMHKGRISVIVPSRSGHIELQLVGMIPGDYQLAIFNMTGQKVMTEYIVVTGAWQYCDIPAGNLLPGIHVIQLTNGAVQYCEKYILR